MGSARFYFLLRPIWARTFGIRYQRIYQLQNIFLAADIHKGVVVHRFFEVNRIQYLNAVARPLQQLPALNQNRTFRKRFVKTECAFYLQTFYEQLTSCLDDGFIRTWRRCECRF